MTPTIEFWWRYDIALLELDATPIPIPIKPDMT